MNLFYSLSSDQSNQNILFVNMTGIRGAPLPFLLVITFCTLFIIHAIYVFIYGNFSINYLPLCSCPNLLCTLGGNPAGAFHEIWGKVWDNFKPWWREWCWCWCCSGPSDASFAGKCAQHNVLLLSEALGCLFWWKSCTWVMSLSSFMWTV